MHEITQPNTSESLKSKLERLTDVDVSTCYQCGKCTAGCPLNEEMDIKPNQILRMLQLEYPGYEDKILSSLTIWLCLACEQCYSRCPQEVKLPKVMDFLRQESLRLHKVNPKAKDILAFHESFLDEVNRNGKMNEVGLTIEYKLRTLNLMQDVENAPSMLMKGKLGIIPHKVQHPAEIKRLFNKIKGKGGQQ
ncbi:MAG: 4Fe-4S dicluster domain-containing protein [Bacteroidota bacterium]|nr:4Fe-4S dicluster domain-containing protein [Bacteroidota bacterium]